MLKKLPEYYRFYLEAIPPTDGETPAAGLPAYVANRLITAGLASQTGETDGVTTYCQRTQAGSDALITGTYEAVSDETTA